MMFARELFWLLLTLPALGLSVIAISECLQTTSRYYGAKSRKIAGGYNRAMKIMVLSRLFSIIYVFSCSLIIDSGANYHEIIGIALSGGTLSLLAISRILYNFRRTEALDHRSVPKKFLVAAIIANTFNYFGITIPFVFASIFPEYRLTLSNSSFIFNSFFTVINVYYLENVLAQKADSDPSEMASYVENILLARVISCLIMTISYAGALLVTWSVL